MIENIYSVKEILLGYFGESQLYMYILMQAVLLFGLIGIARLYYPKENNYSIKSCTISYLGSWEDERNPKGWRIFSAAFIVAGIMDIPLFLFLHRKLVKICPWSIWIGTSLLLIRAIGLILIAFIPDVGEDFFQDLSLGHMHNLISIITFASFGLGFLVYGSTALFGNSPYSFGTTGGPFLFILGLVMAGSYFLVSWEKKCKKDPTLEHWPGYGLHSYPLWEGILFICHYIAIYWLAINLINT